MPENTDPDAVPDKVYFAELAAYAAEHPMEPIPADQYTTYPEDEQ